MLLRLFHARRPFECENTIYEKGGAKATTERSKFFEKHRKNGARGRI
jgi:hypothetical protein